jgi:hypothetical protein
MPQAVRSYITTNFPRPLPKEAREKIEAKIERYLDNVEKLTRKLDASDASPDLEDNGDDEPSLAGAHYSFSDCCDCEGDDADYEPSPGSPEAKTHMQLCWSQGGRHDCEDDNEELEDGFDNDADSAAEMR